MARRQYFNTYFEVEKFTNFDGTTAVSYTESDTTSPFKMTATPTGIRFEGKLGIGTEDNLRDFARMIADVWRDHEKLTPKVTSTITGH